MKNQRISSPDMIQLIMVERPYKKHAWTIPISKIGGQFITGQDLPLEKMTGEVILTEEERKQYPFVINPTDFYKAPDRKIYNLKDPGDKAMVDIIKLSGMIAESKTEYDLNSVRYIGYFFNSAIEATAKNRFDDEAYEAETLIRNITADQYVSLVLALNWKVDDKEFYIPPRGRTVDELKQHLILAARKYPEKVKNCFPQFNPGIENELFIMELIHYKVLSERPNADIYYKDQFLGSSIQDLIRYLSRGDNDHMRSTWAVLLGEKKGQISSETVEKFMSKSKDVNPVETFSELTVQFQNAIYNENLSEALGYYDKIVKTIRLIPAGLVTFDFDLADKKLNDLRKKTDTTKVTTDTIPAKPTLSEELQALSLDRLQVKIKHHMTAYKEEECKEFWDDKEKLIEYMLSK